MDRSTSSQVFAADGSRLGYIQRRTLFDTRLDRRIPQGAPAGDGRDRGRAPSTSTAGIDINAIARAAIENLEAGKVVQGGSTITQQLVRNLYQRPGARPSAQDQEATLAEELEDAHLRADPRAVPQHRPRTDDQGRTSVGAESASQTYFNASWFRS